MAMESSTKGEENVNVNVEGYKSDSINRARLQSTLAALVDDPILSDVPKNPTLSDVDTLFSLELGSAMRISVLKLDGTSFGTLKLSHLQLSISTNILPTCFYECNCSFILIFLFYGEDVAVMNSATVKDLKLAIKKKVNDVEQSKMGHRHISWYVFVCNFVTYHKPIESILLSFYHCSSFLQVIGFMVTQEARVVEFLPLVQ